MEEIHIKECEENFREMWEYFLMVNLKTSMVKEAFKLGLVE